jgi:hypothetical protein
MQSNFNQTMRPSQPQDTHNSQFIMSKVILHNNMCLSNIVPNEQQIRFRSALRNKVFC